MRTATTDLTNLLHQFGDLVWTDLYTITLAAGTELRYTSHDQPVTYSSKTWARGPLISRGKTSLSIGVNVDKLEVTFIPNTTDTINSVPFMAFAARGGLDGARVKLERLFAANWSATPAGTILLFSGRVGEVQPDRDEVRLDINSDTELLDVMVPRNLYKPGCMNDLYDVACGLSRSAHTVTRTASSTTGSTKRQFNYTRVNANDGNATYFELGVIEFITGANAGLLRTVKVHSVVDGSNAALQSITPWPNHVAVGDQFKLYPGCDKRMSTCNTKFANLIRFRGQPFIPVPETVT